MNKAGILLSVLLLTANLTLAQTIPRITLGEQLLDQLVTGEVSTTLVLKQKMSDGGLNVCGLSTNKTFSSYKKYLQFIGENGCRLKSFLPDDDNDIQFVVCTTTSDYKTSFGHSGSLGINRTITPRSFHFWPSNAVEVQIPGVVSARYRSDDKPKFTPLSVTGTGVVFEHFFSTNTSRARIVLEFKNGEVVTYTQSGLAIIPPQVMLYRIYSDDWWYDEFSEEIIQRPTELSIFVFVDSTFGADTLVESSVDLVEWKKIDEIRWDSYPYLMIELRPNDDNPNLFIRAMSY